ncbi:hypothetical protein [Buttiauxella agrestis]|uniref:Uncharacterized protein n=1 Tax=Buttiauxella agrestis TaxID=82977 RepID=A0A381C5X6_9ENTR|nr:hypothetical protein [Buttiauxella agrestis]MRT11088.1 hypothetical protein [Enterobacteriaceae bacterium RIT711]SUW63286.1 Uncharacterised protein [Buttiauxella agrestis]
MNIAEVKAMRDKVLKAYTDALDAESMGMNGRNLTRQSLDSLKTQYEYWDRKYRQALGKAKPYSLVNFTGRK